MKTRLTLLAAALAATMLGGGALAGQGRGAAGEMRLMDTDRDGRLSAAEHAAGARVLFERMDANNDGTVTAAEMDAAHDKVAAHRRRDGGQLPAEAKIRVIDQDGDGRLTAAEHADGSRRMFERMDSNNDGYVTRDELQAGHDKMLRRQP